MGNFKIKDKRPGDLPKGPLRDALIGEKVRKDIVGGGTGKIRDSFGVVTVIKGVDLPKGIGSGEDFEITGGSLANLLKLSPRPVVMPTGPSLSGRFFGPSEPSNTDIVTGSPLKFDPDKDYSDVLRVLQVIREGDGARKWAAVKAIGPFVPSFAKGSPVVYRVAEALRNVIVKRSIMGIIIAQEVYETLLPLFEAGSEGLLREETAIKELLGSKYVDERTWFSKVLIDLRSMFGSKWAEGDLGRALQATLLRDRQLNNEVAGIINDYYRLHPDELANIADTTIRTLNRFHVHSKLYAQESFLLLAPALQDAILFDWSVVGSDKVGILEYYAYLLYSVAFVLLASKDPDEIKKAERLLPRIVEWSESLSPYDYANIMSEFGEKGIGRTFDPQSRWMERLKNEESYIFIDFVHNLSKWIDNSSLARLTMSAMEMYRGITRFDKSSYYDLNKIFFLTPLTGKLPVDIGLEIYYYAHIISGQAKNRITYYAEAFLPTVKRIFGTAFDSSFLGLLEGGLRNLAPDGASYFLTVEYLTAAKALFDERPTFDESNFLERIVRRMFLDVSGYGNKWQDLRRIRLACAVALSADREVWFEIAQKVSKNSDLKHDPFSAFILMMGGKLSDFDISSLGQHLEELNDVLRVIPKIDVGQYRAAFEVLEGKDISIGLFMSLMFSARDLALRKNNGTIDDYKVVVASLYERYLRNKDRTFLSADTSLVLFHDVVDDIFMSSLKDFHPTSFDVSPWLRMAQSAGLTKKRIKTVPISEGDEQKKIFKALSGISGKTTVVIYMHGGRSSHSLDTSDGRTVTIIDYKRVGNGLTIAWERAVKNGKKDGWQVNLLVPVCNGRAYVRNLYNYLKAYNAEHKENPIPLPLMYVVSDENGDGNDLVWKSMGDSWERLARRGAKNGSFTVEDIAQEILPFEWVTGNYAVEGLLSGSQYNQPKHVPTIFIPEGGVYPELD